MLKVEEMHEEREIPISITNNGAFLNSLENFNSNSKQKTHTQHGNNQAMQGFESSIRKRANNSTLITKRPSNG